jgi:[ribosomal protein S5]-alanine N-acetyltransferase
MRLAEREVTLSPLADADRDEFVAAMRTSRELHRPWISPPVTAEEFEVFSQSRSEPSSACLLARRQEDRAIVGYFDLSEIVRGPFQNAYLAYGANATYAGRGYMTVATRLLLRHAFARLRLHRLEANIQPANAASIALVRRAGFVREGFSERYLKIGGRWRDHERWAIRAEQWREGQARRP